MSFDKDIFKTLLAGQRPDETALRAALTAILNGEADAAQISALLLGLEMIGVNAQDIRIGTEVMRAAMRPLTLDSGTLDSGTLDSGTLDSFTLDSGALDNETAIIDIVGTGGTGLHTLSISTASALVCAGAGAKVAKHGNRAATSLTGTADTLEELGVNLSASIDKMAKSIMKAGVGFLFAPNHHPAMAHVGPARKALGVRTLFNLLGPLCNPACAKRQLLGVSDRVWQRPMAEALRDLGSEHVWLVQGADGLDEITTTDMTCVTELKDGHISEFEISPEDYGIQRTQMRFLRGGTPAENATALTALLQGEIGPYRDIVLFNSGAALMIAGLVHDISAGIALASDSIDNGKAKRALDQLVHISNEPNA